MTEKNKDNKQKQPKLPNKDWRNTLWYIVVALTLTLIVTSFFKDPQSSNLINYSQFKQRLSAGEFDDVTIKTSDKVVVGHTKTNEMFRSYYVDSPTFVSDIESQGVNISVNPTESNWFVGLFMQAFLPFILIAALWFFIFRQAQGANSQALNFGKSKANVSKKGEKQNKLFKDVAGADEAVEELREIVDFLKHPKRYKDIGAKIPKGALLMGPPGTGKTLLAKAIAGEADVPFFSLSGSDFVEMFVGVGASRVRDLFAKAKKAQPAIIFVDELDAVGRHRGAGLGGGHDEREQTLNQLLVEMDGFEEKHTVIVIAATNRPDILDPALLRPGRFDRQIVVDKPDIKGRLDILNIHSKGKKYTKDIELEVVAKRTPGFTGADLENLLNEGALFAARDKRKTITMIDLEKATDKVIAGPERKSRVMPAKEKEIVAYHEVGHAIVAFACKNADPVHKISILPRGRALGYTLQLPLEDKYLQSREDMINQIKILMGGRIAEELIFNEITSGASNDIERATDIARAFICNYGMSKKLGARKYGKNQNQVFLGRDYSDHSKDYSEKTAQYIDEEIQNLIGDAYLEATKILKKYKTKLVEISKLIMEEEVLDSERFFELMGVKPEKLAKAASK